ncbi:MAG: hypothetical protein AB7E34_00360 [Acidaminococcaceae bacterium]
MFAKDAIFKTGSGLSPVLLALLVILFVVQSLYGAYRALLFFTEYMKNKKKDKKVK